MSLQISGKITDILNVEKGTSKTGKDWEKLNFVIDTGAQYNPLICFQIFGDEKVEDFQQRNKVGDMVDVSFNVSSREYNGKYYHNLDAWKIAGANPPSVKNQKPQIEENTEPEDGDLPF